MLDTVGPYGPELEMLELAYSRDNEGLSGDEYFDKYASDGYKEWVAEGIAYIEDMQRKGIRI